MNWKYPLWKSLFYSSYVNFIFLILLLIIFNHRGSRMLRFPITALLSLKVKRDEPKMELKAPELAREGHG